MFEQRATLYRVFSKQSADFFLRVSLGIASTMLTKYVHDGHKQTKIHIQLNKPHKQSKSLSYDAFPRVSPCLPSIALAHT